MPPYIAPSPHTFLFVPFTPFTLFPKETLTCIITRVMYIYRVLYQCLAKQYTHGEVITVEPLIKYTLHSY